MNTTTNTTTKPIPARTNVNARAQERAEALRANPSRPPITATEAETDNDPLFDVGFTRGPARRPAPALRDPLLQWSTGLTTEDRRVYVGWLVEAERNPQLDQALAEAGYTFVRIRHGSGNIVTHWAVETANVFVIAQGAQSIGEMQHTSDRYGIAFGWRKLGAGGWELGAGRRGAATQAPSPKPLAPRMQSQLRARVFLRELLAVGYHEPLTLTVKSTLTGDVITALLRQYDVLDALAAFRKASRKPPLNLPFYACSLPLAPGAPVSRGAAQTKEIAPIVAKTPTPVTKEYIFEHWTRKDWAALAEARLDETVAWSVAASAQIAAGEEEE
jgi:hypothetical protein